VLFFPLAFSLFLGQISVFLVWAMVEAYVALESRRDLRAGLWFGVLLLKPQYLGALVVVLAWKRRWHVLAGLAAVGAIIASASFAVLGVSGLKEFYRLVLTNYTGFQHVQSTVYPDQMISWRGLLLNMLPHVSERTGQTLTLVVSAATIAAVVAAWKGPWEPGSRRFNLAMLATVAAMLLCGYHSHLQDAALLMVPAAAVAARRGSSVYPRVLLLLSTLTFPVVYLMTDLRGVCIATGIMLAGVVATTCVWTLMPGASRWVRDSTDAARADMVADAGPTLD